MRVWLRATVPLVWAACVAIPSGIAGVVLFFTHNGKWVGWLVAAVLAVWLWASFRAYQREREDRVKSEARLAELVPMPLAEAEGVKVYSAGDGTITSASANVGSAEQVILRAEALPQATKTPTGDDT